MVVLFGLCLHHAFSAYIFESCTAELLVSTIVYTSIAP